MKKIILIYVVLIVAVVALAVIQRGTWNLFNVNFKKTPKTPTVTINKKSFDLLVAKTDDEKVKGLSDRDKLDENQGMIFLFDKKDSYGFWMKNMRFPIDIIYVENSKFLFFENNKIVSIVHNAQPPKTPEENLPVYKPSKPANYVIEINAGLSNKYKFKEGDSVSLSNVK